MDKKISDVKLQFLPCIMHHFGLKTCSNQHRGSCWFLSVFSGHNTPYRYELSHLVQELYRKDWGGCDNT